MKQVFWLMAIIATFTATSIARADSDAWGSTEVPNKGYTVKDEFVDMSRISAEIALRETEIRFNRAEIMQVDLSPLDAENKQAKIESLNLKNEVLRSEIEDLSHKRSPASAANTGANAALTR